MSIWGRIFAANYDRIMARTERAGLSARRAALLSAAAGDVLEIGAGTGVNLPFYGSGVDTLTLAEPEPPMVRRLEAQLKDHPLAPKLFRAPAEDLPFNDASFDVAVATLVLCTVDDQPRALRELRRVLRPGGRLLFLEHVRADEPKVARLQDRIHPFNVRLGHGCHCNRPTLDGIRNAGFTVTELERGQLEKAPPWVRPLIAGVAETPQAAKTSDRSVATASMG